MAVLEDTRQAINFDLRKRPTLARKIQEAAEKLGTTPSELSRDIVENFVDAYVEWALRAKNDRERALAAIAEAAKRRTPMGRLSTADDAVRGRGR